MSPTTIRIPSPTLIRFLRAQSHNHLWNAAGPSACAVGNPSVEDLHRTSPGRRPNSYRANVRPEGKCRSRHLGFLNQARRSSFSTSSQPCGLLSGVQRRRFGTSKTASIWSLFGRDKAKSCPPQHTDLPPLTAFLDDVSGLGRILKPTNELKLRCTEFDETGNVTLINGEFKKSELIAKVRGFDTVETSQ